MRILITDADRPFLDLEMSYLQKCGYEVVTATDGLNCIELIRDFTPDVIVLDSEVEWAMKVISEMQENGNQKPIPAILISDTNPINSLRSAIAGWFKKPFGMEDLRQMIASVGSQKTSNKIMS